MRFFPNSFAGWRAVNTLGMDTCTGVSKKRKSRINHSLVSATSSPIRLVWGENEEPGLRSTLFQHLADPCNHNAQHNDTLLGTQFFQQGNAQRAIQSWLEYAGLLWRWEPAQEGTRTWKMNQSNLYEVKLWTSNVHISRVTILYIPCLSSQCRWMINITHHNPVR